MKIIERYADEIEPGDIVLLDGQMFPVMTISRDIYGQVVLTFCAKLNDDGVTGMCWEADLLVNDTLHVAINDDVDDEDEDEL